MSVLGELRQFWSRQVLVGLVSLIMTVAFVLLAPGVIEGIPQTGFEALLVGLATLLGLTFTSLSIITTFMPGLRKDFVRSQTFAAMGATFVLTMAIQLTGVAMAAACFVFYRATVLGFLSPPTVFFSLFSIGLMAELFGYVFSIFEMARRAATE